MLKITDLPATLTMRIEIRKWDVQTLQNGSRTQYVDMRSLECKRALANELINALIDLDVTRVNEKIDVHVWEERIDENMDARDGGSLVITWHAKIEKVPEGEVYFYKVPRPTGRIWIDPGECIECRLCWENCPQDAVRIEETP